MRVLHCSSWTVWNFGCTCDGLHVVGQSEELALEYSIMVELLAYHDSQRSRPKFPNKTYNCHVATATSQIITRWSHKHHTDWPTESLLLADVAMAVHPKVIEPLLVTHWCSILLEDNTVVNNVFNSI